MRIFLRRLYLVGRGTLWITVVACSYWLGIRAEATRVRSERFPPADSLRDICFNSIHSSIFVERQGGMNSNAGPTDYSYSLIANREFVTRLEAVGIRAISQQAVRQYYWAHGRVASLSLSQQAWQFKDVAYVATHLTLDRSLFYSRDGTQGDNVSVPLWGSLRVVTTPQMSRALYEERRRAAAFAVRKYQEDNR